MENERNAIREFAEVVAQGVVKYLGEGFKAELKEVTADYILKIFMEANMGKVERAIREATAQSDQEFARSKGTEDKCTVIVIPQETVCSL